MRKAFCNALLAFAGQQELLFLTGDLGFMALEPLRDAMGSRFINAGIAEQNMISVSAGLARNGLRPWCYSIAPFIYARPYEQIRNDICLHDLPVVLVGNGGGYGYGVMGATHHALEDYGSLLCLAHMRALIPAFDSDVQAVIKRLIETRHPAYLRLGLGEEPKGFTPPPYAPWRRILDGQGPTVVAVGPLAGSLYTALAELPLSHRPRLWALCELPCDPLPPQLLADIRTCDYLIVAEEHVQRGGAGEMLAWQLLRAGNPPRRFEHRFALGYPSGLYGSQKFHRAECQLDPASIAALCTRES